MAFSMPEIIYIVGLLFKQMTKSGPPKPLAPSEYEAIEQAMMETARGRWFLAQFAEKSRGKDTKIVLDAISKLESAINQPRSLPEAERIKKDLVEMSVAIERTRNEIASLKLPDSDNDSLLGATEELDAIVIATEKATHQILQAAEDIQETAWNINEDGTHDAPCARIDNDVTDIYTACSFQDITGQRTQKVVQILRFLESRIKAMVSIWGLDEIEQSQTQQNPGTFTLNDDREDGHLLNGPQLEGKGLNQDNIDGLINENEASEKAPHDEHIDLASDDYKDLESQNNDSHTDTEVPETDITSEETLAASDIPTQELVNEKDLILQETSKIIEDTEKLATDIEKEAQDLEKEGTCSENIQENHEDLQASPITSDASEISLDPPENNELAEELLSTIQEDNTDATSQAKDHENISLSQGIDQINHEENETTETLSNEHEGEGSVDSSNILENQLQSSSDIPSEIDETSETIVQSLPENEATSQNESKLSDGMEEVDIQQNNEEISTETETQDIPESLQDLVQEAIAHEQALEEENKQESDNSHTKTVSSEIETQSQEDIKTQNIATKLNKLAEIVKEIDQEGETSEALRKLNAKDSTALFD